MSSYPPFLKNRFRSYPFLLLLLPLSFGIFMQHSLLPFVEGPVWIIFLLLAGITSLIWHNLAAAAALHRPRTMSMALLLAMLGASLSCYQDQRNHRSWYGNMLAAGGSVQVQISGYAAQRAHTVYLPVTVRAVQKEGVWRQASGITRLYIFRQDSLPPFKPGDELVVPADKFIPLKHSGNPFAFDYAAYAGRNGLFHQAFVAADDILYIPCPAAKQSWLAATRSSMLRSIRLNITDSTTAALVEATILNERGLLDEEIWEAYAATGIVHIIAISGMHVTLLFHVLFFFLFWARGRRLEWVRYMIAIPLVWFYVGLTGFPPSAVRAAVMFTLLAVGMQLKQEINAINILMATAFALLCYNPYWLYDTGFQLSFTAVLSLLIFYGPIRRWVDPPGSILRLLWDTLAVSLSVQVLTFPITIYYFHQFPLWVLIANIPAALFSFMLMIGSVALLVLSMFMPCLWLGNILSRLTGFFHQVVFMLADHTPVFFRELFIDGYDFWLLMMAAALLSAFLFRREKHYLFAGLIAFFAFTADIGLQYYYAGVQNRIVVYNAPRLSLIDLFEGRTVWRLGTDSADKKTGDYILLPSRLGYRVSHIVPLKGNAGLLVQGRSIYFLDGTLPESQVPFQADYLIVSNRCRLDPERWQAIFCPGKIIIDGSLPRWKALRWKEAISQAGIAVHWVQEEGAWIFPR